MFNQSIVQIQFNQLNIVMIICEKLDILYVSTYAYIELFDWNRIFIVIRISNVYSGWFDFNWVFIVIFLMVGFIEWFKMHERISYKVVRTSPRVTWINYMSTHGIV